MRYMHLTSKRTDDIFNPYDALLLAKDNNIIKTQFKMMRHVILYSAAGNGAASAAKARCMGFIKMRM